MKWAVEIRTDPAEVPRLRVGPRGVQSFDGQGWVQVKDQAVAERARAIVDAVADALVAVLEAADAAGIELGGDSLEREAALRVGKVLGRKVSKDMAVDVLGRDELLYEALERARKES